MLASHTVEGQIDTACSKYLFITSRDDFENKHIYTYIYIYIKCWKNFVKTNYYLTMYFNNAAQVMVRSTLPDDNKSFDIQYGRKNVQTESQRAVFSCKLLYHRLPEAHNISLLVWEYGPWEFQHGIIPPNLNNKTVIGRSRHVTGWASLRLVGGRIPDLDRNSFIINVLCLLGSYHRMFFKQC